MLTLRLRLEPDLFGGLAREDFWLDAVETPVLFLWRGEKGVVLGKNQNPWLEANLTLIRERGLRVARRVSGGGCVVHDPGNLNISWLLPRADYQPERLHAILRRALERLGMSAETTAAGATLVRGRKVSGSAYCHRRERVLHHSTLLWQADVDTLRAALSVPRIHVKTHAVASLPAQVANLCDARPGCTLAELIDALKTAASEHFGPLAEDSADEKPLDPAYLRKMLDPQWIWGQTPRFQAEMVIAGKKLWLEVAKGRFENITLDGIPLADWMSETLDADFPRKLARILGRDSSAIEQSLLENGWDFRLLPPART